MVINLTPDTIVGIILFTICIIAIAVILTGAYYDHKISTLQKENRMLYKTIKSQFDVSQEALMTGISMIKSAIDDE